MEDLAGDSKELSDMVSFLRNVTRGILRWADPTKQC
jgi:UDP-N-acetylglucosamine acyltransferase